MKLTRRSVLRATALGSGASALTGCDQVISDIGKALGEATPEKLAVAASAEVDADFHLLSRAAFGPWPGDLERVRKMGRTAWLEEQLHPERISDTACDLRAERFESLYFSAGDAYEFRKPVLRDEITRHSLLRAIYSRRQLFEVMVEFWTDHLNIDLEKGDCIYLKPTDDREVIRKHALGNFHDLIRASVTSPAMLVYLDGKSNKIRKGTDDKPNENYARELMELHTLGVNGGYTQHDILEAARCLSGWTFDPKRFFAINQSEPFFKPDWHDNGEKRVLGRVIPAGGGEKDIDLLVAAVCEHPSTARYIATKLCHRFVSATAPAALVDRVAAEFTRTKGDIKAVLRALFASEEFAASRGQLLKRPFKFIVSAMRALGADTHAEKSVIEPLNRMGHGLFQYPTPDGYPDEETPWMGTLMWRWNFALALGAQKIPGVKFDLGELMQGLGGNWKSPPEIARWFAHLTGRLPTELEKTALLTGIGAPKSDKPQDTAQNQATTISLILASPAFQRC
jgi:uncharacterized protein (DUF1800 family)